MWYEYPIPADSKKQRKIIRQLKTWIKSLESQGLVEGYAFNHYSPPNELRIRFDCSEDKLETIRKELEPKVRKFVPEYIAKKRPQLWNGGKRPEHIYKAYEFGTRCTFLAWELVENKRFPKEYFSNFYKGESEKGAIVEPIPFDFQTHFSHGIMNSLGISKTPNELLIHLNLLMNCIQSQRNFIKAQQILIDSLHKKLRELKI